MRKLHLLWSTRTLILALLLFVPVSLKADDAIVMFGLTNQAINGASVTTSESHYGLRVDDLGEDGDKGVSVLLGEANSGLYFSPQLNSQPQDGNYMQAKVYGKASGLDGLLGTVFCRRDGYGLYPMTVDFSPLGSSNFTVQVYCYDTLVREETNDTGIIIFHSDSVGNLYPRVNPAWRAPDGSVGVLVTFQASLINLDHGLAYGDRVFMKPLKPTNSVEYVSKVDIFGGGGLTYFEGWGEWIGMYSLPHAALGAALFAAQEGNLSIGGIGGSGDDGVMVELGGASSYEMDLEPFAFATNSTISISANGIGDSYSFYGRNFLGPIYIRDNNGTVGVSGSFGADPTNRVLISVLNSGAVVGTLTVTNGAWGTITNESWKLSASGVLPQSGNNASALYVKFDRPVTFTPATAGTPLTGNQMQFSWFDVGPDNGSFQNFQLQASGMAAFTITNGVTTAAAPETLTIARAGTDVQVSWPYRQSATILQNTPDLNVPFTNTNLPPYELIGSQWQFKISPTSPPEQFFRLFNWCARYNSDLASE
ncbi:MAG TPA: hypothetical protein VMZ27_07770 [Candidatus Saccharimonadales bacterium]|nr:hypothetical protein [Candidatus Saccharimonadales bacterium]